MLKYLFTLAATRAAGDAVDGIARRALWGAIAALFLLTSFVLSLMVVFWIYEPTYGAVPVALSIAAICGAAALLAIAMPALADWSKRRTAARAKIAAAAPPPSVMSEVSAAVDEDTAAAVDYFGALQVVASAFMFGLGAARQMRNR